MWTNGRGYNHSLLIFGYIIDIRESEFTNPVLFLWIRLFINTVNYVGVIHNSVMYAHCANSNLKTHTRFISRMCSPNGYSPTRVHDVWSSAPQSTLISIECLFCHCCCHRSTVWEQVCLIWHGNGIHKTKYWQSTYEESVDLIAQLPVCY